MKSILLLGFLAVSSSTPLGWGGATGGWYGIGIASSPAETASSQIDLQIQGALEQNAVENQVSGTGVSNQGKQIAEAQRVAQDVVHQALRARQGQTAEGIEVLKQQLQQQPGVFGSGRQSVAQQLKQVSTVDALNQLQQHLQMQQSFAPLIQTGSPLAQTLEAAIQAQMVSDSVNALQLGWSGQTSQTPGQSSQVFRAKIQQLIDQCNIQEIQAEIAKQQAKIKQLQQQQQLINQLRQQIQAQQAISSQQNQGSAPVVQLQQIEQELQVHEHQLVRQQLARQLILQQLQQALVEQQQQLQQDIVSEQVAQSWVEEQHPRSRGLQKIVGAQWSQYRYPITYGSNWNLLKRPRDQSVRSWSYTPFNLENSWRQGVRSTQLELIQ